MKRLAIVATALLLGANLLIGLGALFCQQAYASGDPSGLQYMFLFIGALAAGAGVVPLMLSRLVPGVPLLALVPMVSATGVWILSSLPQLTGLGYNGSRIDGPGSLAGIILLALHVPIALVSTGAALRAGRAAPALQSE